jgi:hypothetical protein
MSSLPPAYINGNILDASELNLMRAARNGDLTPINPGTNNELDDAYDIGTPTVRWQNGNYSGQVNADGQSRIFANAVGQGMTQGVETLISWQSPSVNVGASISVPSATKFVFADSGGYIVTLQTIMIDNLATQIRGRIRHFNSTPTLIRAYHNFTNEGQIGNVNAPSQLSFSVIVFANQDDELDATITRYDADAGLSSSSTITIVKIF